jgi:nicotinate-nucleotide adenylyltransferase
MSIPHLRNGTRFAGLKIGLLGGSFNPAHAGHVAISLYALKHLGLDQIWWLVSPQNPLKDARDMAVLDRRVAQAKRLATHPRFVVTTIESALGTRYTADTLRVLRRRFPHTRFVWLMGADNLQQIPRWKGWQDIFHGVPVAVFRRPSYPAGRTLGKAAVRFDRAWRKPEAVGKSLPRKPVPAWIILDNKLNYISATQIRKDDPSWHQQKSKFPPRPKKP